MDERTNQLIHAAMGVGFTQAFMDDVGDNSLEHYGVKGMKWYQHLFGEKDGRAAYANGGEGKNETDGGSPKGGSSGSKSGNSDSKPKETISQRITRARNEKAQKAEAKKQEEAKKAEAQKAEEEERQRQEAEANREKWKSDPAQMMKHRELYTNDELRTAIERFTLEDRLSQISANRTPPEPKVKSKVDTTIEVSMKVANGLNNARNIAKTSVDFYNTAADIYNTFTKSEKKWPKIKELAKEDKYLERTKKATAEQAEARARLVEEQLAKFRRDNS